jgi:hypothetical protein
LLWEEVIASAATFSDLFAAMKWVKINDFHLENVVIHEISHVLRVLFITR